MKAVSMILAGGVGLAALASAAPAAAQYYPGYGYGNGNVVGDIINGVLGAQRYGYGAQGYANDRVLIDRCAASVEQRINRDYGYRYGSPYGGYGSPYGGYGSPYGGYNNNAGGARVLGISRVERRSSTTVRVRGTATVNGYASAQPYGGYGNPYGGYGNPYGGYGNYGYQQAGELSFKCDVDIRNGRIKDIDLDRRNIAYSPYRRY